MKERPLLFQSSMIRGLANTRPGTWPAEPIDPSKPYKTQTRRVMKIQPDGVSIDGTPYKYKTISVVREQSIERIDRPDDNQDARFVDVIKCPHGQPGDRLWSKETWRAEELEDGLDGIRYIADAAFIPIENSPAAAEAWGKANYCCGRNNNWKPSIFQPRWASRFLLELMEVRVERVKSISRADCIADGLYRIMRNDSEQDIRVRYRELWDSINGKKHPWESNPFVWVLSFKVLPK